MGHSLYVHEGDVVAYHAYPLCGPVKGRVTAVMNDVTGLMIAFVVTSRTHALYQAGTELTVSASDPKLRKRQVRRYGR